MARRVKVPPGAAKLGMDPCSDTEFYARLTAGGQLTIWGKSRRDGRVWTALPAFKFLPRLLAEPGHASPFPIRELG